MLKARVLTLIATAALAFPATSLAATRTTLPTKTMMISFFITDHGIRPYYYEGSAVGFLPYVGTTVPRGDYLKIYVLNRTKKPRNFSIFGKTVSAVRPGKTAHLFHIAVKRGSFRWWSQPDKGKKGFHGTVTVA
jgi:hypothetical protein